MSKNFNTEQKSTGEYLSFSYVFQSGRKLKSCISKQKEGNSEWKANILISVVDFPDEKKTCESLNAVNVNASQI